MIKTIRQKGFTLIEILLYFMIIGTVMFAVLSFSLQIISISDKSDNYHEIQTNIDFITNKITSTIRNANSVDVSGCTFNNDLGTLSLNMPNAGDSPTKFYLTGQKAYIKKGINDATRLSSDSIKCTQLKFQRIEGAKSPDQIVIDAQCEPLYTDLESSNVEISIHTSVALRRI